MGHTLVTQFGASDLERIRELMKRIGGEDSNKIPFGRDCDRTKANQKLPYHITVAHWAKREDETCIKRLEGLQVAPSEVLVVSHSVVYAEEGSMLLYFNIRPGEAFIRTANDVERLIPGHISSFWHMTLAVSKDYREIQELAGRLTETARYPFSLHVTGLDLYHIWKPVEFVRTYHNGIDG